MNIKIENNDCLIEMNKLNDNSIDLILTDVPYWVDFKWNYDDTKEYVFSNHIKWLSEMYRVLKEWNHCYIFIPTLEIDKWVSWAKYVWFNLKNILTTRTYTTNRYISNNFKFDNQFILYLSKWKAKRLNQVNWIKTSESWLNDKRNKNPHEYTYSYPSFIREYFWNQKPNKKTKNIHWNEKNVEFCKTLILLSSNPWDIVLDPFLWSWTTGISCIQLWDRDFIWYEKNKDNYNLSLRRINTIKNN